MNQIPDNLDAFLMDSIKDWTNIASAYKALVVKNQNLESQLRLMQGKLKELQKKELRKLHKELLKL